MYTEIENQTIYYQKIGSGKKNLIALHGWGADVSSFWNLANLLKEDCTLYLIDLPGFGRSDLPKRAFYVSDYAKLIAVFIENMQLKKPDILGHSVGGRIAVKLAAQNPQLIDKLILEDAAGIKPKRDIPKVIFYFLAKIFKYLVPNIFNFKEKVRLKFYHSLESDYITAGPMKETLRNILAEDLTPELSKIPNDTLLLWGEKDPTLEASLKNGKKMYRLIKNARIEVLEGLGHFPHLEKPTLFAYYVKDFI
jgi:pimeloyl-ACP methyl ester carboxylesterase